MPLQQERRDWLAKLENVVLSSDACFPFRDNIDCVTQVCKRSAPLSQFARLQFGIKYINSPGGSTRDDEIIDSADAHNLVHIGTFLTFQQKTPRANVVFSFQACASSIISLLRLRPTPRFAIATRKISEFCGYKLVSLDVAAVGWVKTSVSLRCSLSIESAVDFN